MSSDKRVVGLLEEAKVLDSLLQIIFNVMKAMDKDDLKLKKHLMVQTDGTKIGAKGEIIREITPNSNEELEEEHVIVALNIENLRLALLIITNMCTLSPESQKHFLQLDSNNLDPKVTGSHFLVLLAW
jgi:hypothetical protein